MLKTKTENKWKYIVFDAASTLNKNLLEIYLDWYSRASANKRESLPINTILII